MKTTFIFSILFFLLFSATSFCRLKGTWRQVFPEENGAIPGARYDHYMCSIGDGQVLMVGGNGGGNPHHYNETWLYSYKSNTWTKVECDTMPNTYYSTAYPDEIMCQIADNMVLSIGFVDVSPTTTASKTCLFHLDSLKWYVIEGRIPAIHIGENLGWKYRIERGSLGERVGQSNLIHINSENPFDSPDFLTIEVINNEEITKQGPNYNYNDMVNDPNTEEYFAYYDSNKVTWIPATRVRVNFMAAERDVWNWLFLEQSQDSLPLTYRRKYSQLTKNATLMHDDGYSDDWVGRKSDFYIIEYSPEANQMSTYKIDAPGNGIYNCKMAQIQDGIVMLFGGMSPNGLSNETWIFELDHLDVVDNTGENVNIYILDDNLYMLGSDLKDAALYNILGQKVVAVTGDKLDLNPLPIGIYFLQYNEKGVGKAVKVRRR